MALKIKASSLFEKRYLVVEENGVKFYESSFVGGKRRFSFDQIQCILMSADFVLSFQVGEELFSIQTSPQNKKHQAAVETFVRGVTQAAGREPARA